MSDTAVGFQVVNSVGWGGSRWWLRRILLLCLVILSAAVAYLYWRSLRVMGEGPAGPAVVHDFSEPWTQRRVELLGIGDSVTKGLGAARASHSYFERLAVNPEDEWNDMQGKCLERVLPNLLTNNIAVSGSTSLHHEQYIDEQLEPRDASTFGLVVMTTGGNDLIHMYGLSPPKEGAMYGASTEQALPWIDSFRERLDRMLDKVIELYPGGCEIYLADIYDPTDGVGDAASIWLPAWKDGLEIHARYNEILQNACTSRENVFHVPLYETFLGHGSHYKDFWRDTYCSDDPYHWYFTNIEDPNDRGYDAIRRIFLNAICENTSLKLNAVSLDH